ncbi:pyridoxal kinase-like [Halichondria panicea]|uniref:pyridoxal kinase-like n=1 Tax=Halichondria panicea TaxID=6063 RepID=UPI00312B3603
MASVKRVLSIQGHPTRGYAGNTSATFTLQISGFDVDTIHSAQFSNHPGYKVFGTGPVLSAQDLINIIDGLRENDLLTYSHLLIGYIADKSFLEQVHSVALELKEKNKDLMFVCDPVLGDNGAYYVPQELQPVYKEKLIPIADLITPNTFEAEKLTGITIETEEDAMKAIDKLLSFGPKTVFLTSMQHETKPDVLVTLGKNQKGEYARVEMPRIPALFTGTGDMFCALLLAWSCEPLQIACEKAVCIVNAMLKKTLSYALEMSGGGPPKVEHLELRLIQNTDIIKSPPPISELFL